MILRLYRLDAKRRQGKIILSDAFIKENNINTKNKLVFVSLYGMKFLSNVTYSRIKGMKKSSIQGIITIPKKLIESLKLKDGQDIEIKVENDS